MSKPSVGLTIDEYGVDAKLGEKLWEQQSASAVTGIDGNLEIGAANALNVEVA